jgi:predicted  nucleic acid-binding Zn-ribbon protein
MKPSEIEQKNYIEKVDNFIKEAELIKSNKRSQYVIDKYHGGNTQAYVKSEVNKAVDAVKNQSQGEIAELRNQLKDANNRLGAANKRIAGFEKGAAEKAAEKAKEVGQSVSKAAEEAVAKEAAEEAAPWYKKAMKNKWVKYGVPVAAVGGLGAYAYGRSRNRREREYYD